MASPPVSAAGNTPAWTMVRRTRALIVLNRTPWIGDLHGAAAANGLTFAV